MELINDVPIGLWLEIATRPLCDEARKRVCTEIESHYIEAVRTSIESGRILDDAHHEVMAALGDPKVARKALKRVYLTKRDEKRHGHLRRACSLARSRYSWPFYLKLFSFVASD